jgi:hypothetical protein
MRPHSTALALGKAIDEIHYPTPCTARELVDPSEIIVV